MKASPAPKGALASLLRGKKPKEEEENEVAQSSPEELKKQQQAVQEALLNSLPGDEQLKHEHQTSPEPLRWRQLRRRRFLHPVSFGTPPEQGEGGLVRQDGVRGDDVLPLLASPITTGSWCLWLLATGGVECEPSSAHDCGIWKAAFRRRTVGTVRHADFKRLPWREGGRF